MVLEGQWTLEINKSNHTDLGFPNVKQETASTSWQAGKTLHPLSLGGPQTWRRDAPPLRARPAPALAPPLPRSPRPPVTRGLMRTGARAARPPLLGAVILRHAAAGADCGARAPVARPPPGRPRCDRAWEGTGALRAAAPRLPCGRARGGVAIPADREARRGLRRALRGARQRGARSARPRAASAAVAARGSLASGRRRAAPRRARWCRAAARAVRGHRRRSAERGPQQGALSPASP